MLTRKLVAVSAVAIALFFELHSKQAFADYDAVEEARQRESQYASLKTVDLKTGLYGLQFGTSLKELYAWAAERGMNVLSRVPVIERLVDCSLKKAEQINIKIKFSPSLEMEKDFVGAFWVFLYKSSDEGSFEFGMDDLLGELSGGSFSGNSLGSGWDQGKLDAIREKLKNGGTATKEEWIKGLNEILKTRMRPENYQRAAISRVVQNNFDDESKKLLNNAQDANVVIDSKGLERLNRLILETFFPQQIKPSEALGAKVYATMVALSYAMAKSGDKLVYRSNTREIAESAANLETVLESKYGKPINISNRYGAHNDGISRGTRGINSRERLLLGSDAMDMFSVIFRLIGWTGTPQEEATCWAKNILLIAGGDSEEMGGTPQLLYYDSNEEVQRKIFSEQNVAAGRCRSEIKERESIDLSRKAKNL